MYMHSKEQYEIHIVDEAGEKTPPLQWYGTEGEVTIDDNNDDDDDDAERTTKREKRKK